MLAALSRSGTSVRMLLAATVLLGLGQQIFVVARNPLLAELGYRTDAIPFVQASGALAGVLAGVLATWATPRMDAAVVFGLCSLLQATGFAVQANASAPMGFLVGSALAGVAIQLNTAMIPPVLHRLSEDDARPTIFTAHSIALTALAGLLAAAVVSAATHVRGQTVGGHRAALYAGVAASLLATALFARVEAAPVQRHERWRLEDPRRVILCVALQGLTAFAGGIMLPFLQIYFKLTFGVSLQGVAWIYAGTMAMGTVSFVLAPVLVARFGLMRTIVGLQLLILPLFFELASATNTRVAAAAFIGRHAVAATVAPLSSAFYQRVSRGRDGEAVAGLGMVTASVTWAAGTLLAGPLIAEAKGGFGLALQVSAAMFGIVALVGLLALPRLWRSRPRIG